VYLSAATASEDRRAFRAGRPSHSSVTHASWTPLQHAVVREEQGRRPGGRGLAITRSLVEELIDDEARNEVVFVKYLVRGARPLL